MTTQKNNLKYAHICNRDVRECMSHEMYFEACSFNDTKQHLESMMDQVWIYKYSYYNYWHCLLRHPVHENDKYVDLVVCPENGDGSIVAYRHVPIERFWKTYVTPCTYVHGSDLPKPTRKEALKWTDVTEIS